VALPALSAAAGSIAGRREPPLRRIAVPVPRLTDGDEARLRRLRADGFYPEIGRSEVPPVSQKIRLDCLARVA
jgi:hypothetical protein